MSDSSTCKKIQFDKKGAQAALNRLLKRGTFKEGYGRIYHCRLCKFWHLTSHKKHQNDAPEESISGSNALQHENEWLQLLNNDHEILQNEGRYV